ncbi:LysR family transcriptional regulator [Pandoraea fibrosis]|uniref:LysR family transcriptional regulator n=1 Tax=Pandoraea fibrosis TaxID=1891094 RepID=A0ABX6HKD8_9BURK|nr:LysR family transcriptional regulator [Pandoraea fibrosis]QHE90401.1 LysR family transcriptional regulator [Pandoraea fibrosis]QHF11233.1 LysR family transcriptional regulator [Pandoraea fibrosis]
MDMRHLRSFVAVAEELSFSRAAERLHISQPPLTQHIKALEAEMGVQLFARTKREVRLTDAGVVFLRESRLLLDQLRTAVNATIRTAKSDAGTLRVGVATAALFGVMPTFLSLMREAFPHVVISVNDMQSQDQVVAVAQGALDLGIVHVRPDRMKLSHAPIFSESLVAVVPEHHWLASKPDFTLADMASEPMVGLSREHGPAIFDAIVACCHRAGFSPEMQHSARNPLTIFQMVRLGFGVSLVPRAYAHSAFPGVRFREMPTTAGSVRMEAIWSERHASALTHKIVTTILPRLAGVPFEEA